MAHRREPAAPSNTPLFVGQGHRLDAGPSARWICDGLPFGVLGQGV